MQIVKLKQVLILKASPCAQLVAEFWLLNLGEELVSVEFGGEKRQENRSEVVDLVFVVS